jgi:hypothetical protein
MEDHVHPIRKDNVIMLIAQTDGKICRLCQGDKSVMEYVAGRAAGIVG